MIRRIDVSIAIGNMKRHDGNRLSAISKGVGIVAFVVGFVAPPPTRCGVSSCALVLSCPTRAFEIFAMIRLAILRCRV